MSKFGNATLCRGLKFFQNKKLLYIFIVVALMAIILIPLFTQNHIVKNILKSSDMKAHLEVVTSSNPQYHYYGQMITRYLMRPFANSEHLGTIYLCFNFAVLLLVAIVISWIAYKVVGGYAASTITFILLFGSTGILALFKYGVIYNVINMYVILPIIVYLLMAWFNDKQHWKVIVALLLAMLCSMFHYTGLYIAYAVGLAIFGYVLYALWQKKSVIKALTVAALIIVINLVFANMFVHRTGQLQGDILVPKAPIESGLGSIIQSSPTENQTAQVVEAKKSLLRDWYDKSLILIKYISVPVILLLILAVILWSIKTPIEKGYLYLIGCMATVLIGGYFVEVVRDFNRLALDASSMIAIFTALVIGAAMRLRKSWKFNLIVYAMVAWAVVPNMIIWIWG